MATISIPDYDHRDTKPSHAMAYLIDAVVPFLPPAEPSPGEHLRVLEMGAGNGSFGGHLMGLGYHVSGIDPSGRSVELARQGWPDAKWELGVAEPGVLDRIQEAPFDIVTSLEVIEHVYAPRCWAAACFEALKPGGTLVCTTPYHGYLKNLLIAIEGGWDRHFTALWDGGHIKFWSYKTLCELLGEAGFTGFKFRGAGRLPYLWKSMVVCATKPA